MRDDFYITPSWATKLLMKYETFGEPILEPAVGQGMMSNVLKESYDVIGLDINPAFSPDITTDYLSWKPNQLFESIVTNPPYLYAMEYINKSLKILPEGGKLALLLRLNFLESRERYGFWKEHPPAKIYVLAERPSFIPNKTTDSIAYAWFIFIKGYNSDTKLKVISKSELE